MRTTAASASKAGVSLPSCTVQAMSRPLKVAWARLVFIVFICNGYAWMETFPGLLGMHVWFVWQDCCYVHEVIMKWHNLRTYYFGFSNTMIVSLGSNIMHTVKWCEMAHFAVSLKTKNMLLCSRHITEQHTYMHTHQLLQSAPCASQRVLLLHFPWEFWVLQWHRHICAAGL